ncbi:carbamoyl-phosphate synthase (glutamine-hydrolyzing) large subunit [bacterium]|nr:carbamoyl-phosphate synthase (glutamine-hydrolyzing) large subunit [bacterium]
MAVTLSKPKCILLLGSGGLRIGQAGEFDYSGSQAIKAYKEEGIRVVLLNPNIATVQTDIAFQGTQHKDRSLADEVYYLPLTIEHATEVIQKEKPDAIALSFGGQTALNLGLALEKKGVLKKYGVRVLGTPTKAIRDTEDRKLFVQRLKQIKVDTAQSIATKSVAEALSAAEKIGYPVMIRSGFALGGEGSGRVANAAEMKQKTTEVFKSVPQILVEEYLGGWKEVEYEVVRDCADNCITVCNMENIDPMGIHTGESIVVAPSQTLNNHEYHMLRTVATKTIRHLGIVGECNIQYALNPDKPEYRVIEVNARLSRSSALASKATGYPLAYVAAKLSLGYTLTELKNAVTKTTTACFEPALDYLVLKFPRWDLQKFDSAHKRIGTEMKSVGEVMAIGRSFEEVLQKAIRSLNIGATGFTAQSNKEKFTVRDYEKLIKEPTTERIFAIAEALRDGISVETIHQWSRIDRFFLSKMHNIITLEKKLTNRTPDSEEIREAKKIGFSDAQLALMSGRTEDDIRSLRLKYNIRPSIKQIDTLAAEFPAQTNYLYCTYHGIEDDVVASKKHYVVLGSGPYCIGSSVEFDWSSVQVLKTLRAKGMGSIMVNSNPETVSTDYDESDRLYFEELTRERILDIIDFEKPAGVFISTGGQIANNLALPLYKKGVQIMGTSPIDIDRAEDRHIFSNLCDTLDIDQPTWGEFSSTKAALKKAAAIGYPVIVRPSYVLSGAAMTVAHDEHSLVAFLKKAKDISREHPVVISQFIENAREIEIDGVAQSGKLKIYAISEHVENAGTHSGDATVVLPPQRTYLETVRRAKEITKKLIQALNITGPFNAQFLAKDNHIKVIECNVRASRSFPFVSKVTGYNFIELAARAMLGEDISGEYQTVDLDHVAVKSPQFSFSRIKGADPIGRVEMSSTGEVACFGGNLHEALILSMKASGFRLPKKNILVSLGREENKVKLLESVRSLHEMGFTLFATEHTADFLKAQKIPNKRVLKISSVEGKRKKKELDVGTLIESGELDLIINIPTHIYTDHIRDGFIIRRKAVDMNIPLITNRQLAEAFVTALQSTKR